MIDSGVKNGLCIFPQLHKRRVLIRAVEGVGRKQRLNGDATAKIFTKNNADQVNLSTPDPWEDVLEIEGFWLQMDVVVPMLLNNHHVDITQSVCFPTAKDPKTPAHLTSSTSSLERIAAAEFRRDGRSQAIENANGVCKRRG